MDSLGYNSYYQVLNAKHYGIPQNRERVFTVSIRKDIDTGLFKFPKPMPLTKRLKDILEEEVDEKYYLSDRIVNFYKKNTRDQAAKGNGFRFEPTDGDVIAKALTTRAGGRMDDNYIKQVAQLYGTEREPNPQAGRVYDAEGISPTMDSCNGGNRMPKIAIPQATQKGFIECEAGGIADLSYPQSKTRRGRVQEGGKISPTITAENTGICYIEPSVIDDTYKNREERIYTDSSPAIRAGRSGLKVTEPYIAASRGRNPENPSERTTGTPTEQRLEAKTDGMTNTITSVQKDNYLVEPQKFRKVDLNGNVTDEVIERPTGVRIRKLTPKECWRLMGFPDEVFEKAEAVNSNTQLYKQAGNSIVVDVLAAILEQLFPDKE